MHDSAPTGHAPASPIDGLPQPIDGLDSAAGIRRMDGDVELYIELLRDFVTDEGNAADVIADALAQADADAATRRAHTVKGLAGTFGAVRLYPAALALEHALREGLPPAQIDAHLQVFSRALAELVAELAAKLPAAPMPDVPDDPLDPARLSAACRELLPLLIDCDTRAGRVLDAHAGLLRAAFPDDFPRLAEAVRNFDFEIAEARLLAACAARGLPDPSA